MFSIANMQSERNTSTRYPFSFSRQEFRISDIFESIKVGPKSRIFLIITRSKLDIFIFVLHWNGLVAGTWKEN